MSVTVFACDQWPGAVALSVIAIALAAAYAAWRFTGGRHYGERRR